MKIIRIAVVVVICSTRCAASTAHWCTPLQVEEISLAAEIADYPIKQTDLKAIVGTFRVAPDYGAKVGDSVEWRGALTDPASEIGFYAVRLLYSTPGVDASTGNLMLKAVSVVFITQHGTVYIRSRPGSSQQQYAMYRAWAKKLGVTPIEFARRFFEDPEALKGPEG